MRTALVNENADLVQQNPKYVMKITGDDKVGKGQLSNFEDVTSKYPVLVTTSKLLTTGVNVKTCKLIVLDQNINSMTEFKQIIGRGTRLDEAHGKTFFTIMDFKGASRLFADPKFDGEPEDTVIDDDGQGGVDFNNDDKKTDKKEESDIGDKVSEGRTKYLVNNKQVQIVNSQAEYLDADGKLITTSLRDYTKKNVLGQYATLDKFIEE